jgi:hypothetical protein
MVNKLNFQGAKPLNSQSGLPSMSAAMAGWSKPLTLGIINQVISVDGDRQSTVEKVDFMGTIQPLSVKSLTLKPEGQRSWSWLQIHAETGSLNLRTQDLIIIDNVEYKVMGVLNYSRNGYMEYHVVTDYMDLP